jgi:hypothetical protein
VFKSTAAGGRAPRAPATGEPATQGASWATAAEATICRARSRSWLVTISTALPANQVTTHQPEVLISPSA